MTEQNEVATSRLGRKPIELQRLWIKKIRRFSRHFIMFSSRYQDRI